jgi:hypothetical protein
MENEKLFSAKEMMDFAWWFSGNSGQFSNDASSMEDYLQMWGLEKIVENMNKENSERIPIIRG